MVMRIFVLGFLLSNLEDFEAVTLESENLETQIADFHFSVDNPPINHENPSKLLIHTIQI